MSSGIQRCSWALFLSCFAAAIVAAPLVNETGTLTGRILYDGTPPAPRKIDFSHANQTDNAGRTNIWTDADRYAKLGLLDESLLVSDDGGIANAIVWVRSKDVPPPPIEESLPPAILGAKEGRFDPHVLVFWNAAPLVWINEMDGPVTFNWRPMRNNQAGRLLKSQERIEIEAKKSDPVPGSLFNNLHPWMSAYILPLDHPYFAVTGSDGRFEIKNLPLAKWEFAIWHEKIGWLKTARFPTGKFTWNVGAGDNDVGDVRVAPEAFASRDGSAPNAPRSNRQQQPPQSSRRTLACESSLADCSATLSKLLEQVRHALPPGWRAEITPDVPLEMRLPWRRDELPCLVVWRTALTPAEIVAPGRGSDPSYKRVQVSYQLSPTRFYSLDAYAQSAQQNFDRNRQRENFALSIPGMPKPGKYKGSFPPLPAELPLLIKVRSPEQTELMRQYTLLCSRTEPELLPTHYFQTVSLLVERERYDFEDKLVGRECDEVWESLLSLVVAYPDPASIANPSVEAANKARERVATLLGRDIFRSDIDPPPEWYAERTAYERKNGHTRGFETPEQYPVNRLTKLIWQPLVDEFKKAHYTEPTDAEIDEFLAQQRLAKLRRISDSVAERRRIEQRIADKREQLQSPDLPEIKKKSLEESIASEETRIAEIERARQHDRRETTDEKRRFFARWWIAHWKLHRALYQQYGGRVIWQQVGIEAIDGMRDFLREQESQGRFAIHDDDLRARFWAPFVKKDVSFLVPNPDAAFEHPWSTFNNAQ